MQFETDFQCTFQNVCSIWEHCYKLMDPDTYGLSLLNTRVPAAICSNLFCTKLILLSANPMALIWKLILLGNLLYFEWILQLLCRQRMFHVFLLFICLFDKHP